MIGETVSHYTILEKLGEGGMGVVYKAHDLKLDRMVALKFLPPETATSQDELARFEQEARAISALNHPSIATIHDVDEAGKKKFLVLEYIPGGTLKSKIKRLKAEDKELSVAEILDYGIQIAEGLAHAHRHGIVHRDVKTENVMLTEEGRVKITDFGLAKLRGSVHLTKTGSTIGTAAYMSPEQIRGEDIDNRSDLFSYGIVLYELSTTHLPFRGEHETALSYSILNEEPSPAEAARPALPSELTEVINRCLEKEKEKRYQTAEEIAEGLRQIQHESTGVVKTVVRRSKLPWVIAAAAISIAGVLFYFIRPGGQPRLTHGKTIAVLPFSNLSGKADDEYFSDGMMEDILTQLSKIADLNVISRTSVMQYKGTTKTIPQIGRELNAGAILEGSVRQAGSRMRIAAQLIEAGTDRHIWAETYDRDVKDIFDVQSDVAQKIAAALRARLSANEKALIEKKPTENIDAYTYCLRARELPFGRTRSLEMAISLCRKATALDPNFALAYATMGKSYANLYVQTNLRATLDSSLTLARKALSIDPNLSEGYIALGAAYGLVGSHDSAIQSLEKAVTLNPNSFATVSGLGSEYHAEYDYPKAIQFYKKSILLNPTKSHSYLSVADIYSELGDVHNALLYCRKAEELEQRDPDEVLRSLAWMELMDGRSGEAIAHADSLIARYSDDTLNYSFAGGIHLLGGDMPRARDFFRTIVVKDSGSFSSSILANNTTYLGYILQQMGDKSASQKLYANSLRRSLQDLKEVPRDPSIPYDLAALSALNGGKTEAYSWLRKMAEDGFVNYRLLRMDPLFGSLSHDPQFEQLLVQLQQKAEELRNKIKETEE